MKSKQLFAIMAVLALGLVALAGFAPANDGADEGTISVSFDGNVKLADVQVLFPAATAEKVQYITTLDAKAVEDMSIVSYNAWQAIEDFVDGDVIVYTAAQYTASDVKKQIDNGVKTFGMDDTKTVVSFAASVDASYEIYEEGAVALMIEEAKDGTFTQADIDKAVEDAKKGMYTKEQLDKAVEDAKKSVAPVNDDAQTWQIVCIILGALILVLGFFGGKALIELKNAGGKLF